MNQDKLIKLFKTVLSNTDNSPLTFWDFDPNTTYSNIRLSVNGIDVRLQDASIKEAINALFETFTQVDVQEEETPDLPDGELGIIPYESALKYPNYESHPTTDRSFTIEQRLDDIEDQIRAISKFLFN